MTVVGERVEFTTRRYIKPERWNIEQQKMTGTTDEARIFNVYLKTFEQQVFEEHRRTLETQEKITAEGLKNRLLDQEQHSPGRILGPIFKNMEVVFAYLDELSVKIDRQEVSQQDRKRIGYKPEE